MGVHDPRVDAYIARQREFAQPILTHVREVIHSACPAAVETIKWGAPFFLYRDQMMCHVGAFKEHAALGFWKAARIDGLGAKTGESSAGNFGRLTSIDDLPSRKALSMFVKAAMKLNDDRMAAPKKAAPKKKDAPNTKDAPKPRPGTAR